jgi:DnaK suppressor protein
MKNQIPEVLVIECRKKLLSTKQDILNRFRAAQRELAFSDRGGDEGDQSVAHIAEHSFLVSQERMRNQLLEIEMALSRIENGTFGICEETEEHIEPERLLTIPWTRVSIEGAELRDAFGRRFAR